MKRDLPVLPKHDTALRIAVLLLGIAMTVAGIVRGENGIVLKKAINICLECIGIG